MKTALVVLILLASMAVALLVSTFLLTTVLGALVSFLQGCFWGWIGAKLAIHILDMD